jgi:hypothetical protein
MVLGSNLPGLTSKLKISGIKIALNREGRWLRESDPGRLLCFEGTFNPDKIVKIYHS